MSIICQSCEKEKNDLRAENSKLSDLAYLEGEPGHETTWKSEAELLLKENTRLHTIEKDWLKHDCGILMAENTRLTQLLKEAEEVLIDIRSSKSWETYALGQTSFGEAIENVLTKIKSMREGGV